MVSVSGAYEVTVRASRSIRRTSPRITRTLRWRLRISRVEGATSPAERMPVATWYSSGWNRWCEVRATSVTSSGALGSARAANRPPKPDPMTTTWWRRCGCAAVVPRSVMCEHPPDHEASGGPPGRNVALAPVLLATCTALCRFPILASMQENTRRRRRDAELNRGSLLEAALEALL